MCIVVPFVKKFAFSMADAYFTDKVCLVTMLRQVGWLRWRISALTCYSISWVRPQLVETFLLGRCGVLSLVT